MAFCPRDNVYFCFRHGTVWHHDLTCEKYDAFLADPQSFNLNVQSRKKTQRAAEKKRKQEIQQHIKDRLRAEEAATARVIKHCPNCAVEILKDGGCDHMYCTNCGYRFDWTLAK
ncbi:hypothetical protein F4813DRAFT_386635 [Daldinia decipiens]|uniref:uncharacterized protein n=1 Tax=Daldinia decipiens TaxID=326647 RepID=UPI0020C45BFD|nr:uncharacterized protein F4813DRAFT_386635 [Daldinia decipiens]KAI1660434.1 hypothetical protein F4813DRAFT_386635 [Daldinia decipiens]